MNSEAIKTILKTTVNTGGITFDIKDINREFNKGYVIAKKGYEKQVKVEDFTLDVILDYIFDNWSVLNEDKHCLGTWIDNEIVYIDISIVYDDRSSSIDIARAQGELAIFDLSTFETIYC